MAQPIEEFLLEAIQKDDKKAFDALMEKAQCGGYRLGRFPVLSLMYLYKSGKIIAAYEEKFIKITAWEALREPAGIAKTFSEKAGKCLRLYLSEVISPLEMLLILDEAKRLKRVYPLTKASSSVKDRLQSIYSVKYSLGIKYEGNDIILEKRPLSKKEKKKIVTVCVSVALAVAVAVAAPVTIVSLVPHRGKGEVTKLKHIDFAEDTTYTLQNDITIPADYKVEEMNCEIVGNGKKLIFEKGATIKELNGKISAAEIVSYGTPLFDTVSEKAELSNITVNVTADIATSRGSAFVALTNYGTLEGVKLNVGGKVSALTPPGFDEESTDIAELTFGGLVLNNALKYNTFGNPYYGVIDNCTVNYNNLSLAGELHAEGMFAGIAGINNGEILNSTVKGAINSDMFDLSGVCSVNNYLISGVVNEATLSQVSQGDQWSPLVCGIVAENLKYVQNCENKGALSAKAINETTGNTYGAYTAGIARVNGKEKSFYIDIGVIQGCKNSGSLTAESKGVNYVGGIASVSYGTVYMTENAGNITSVGQFAYVGGVCGVSEGLVQECSNSGSVSAEVGEYIYIGGITGVSTYYIYKAVNGGSLSASGEKVYAGGITAYCNTGVSTCIASGDIDVTADIVCAGGIYGAGVVSGYLSWGNAEYCISKSNISVTAQDGSEVYAGGIAGFVQEANFQTVEGEDAGYFGGGATNCFFVGSIVCPVGFYGGVVGVCGAHIYETNAYEYDKKEYNNFKDNYYIDSTMPSFGATLLTVSKDGEEDGEEVYTEVEGKGATALSRQQIKELEAYLQILSEFGNLNLPDHLKF